MRRSACVAASLVLASSPSVWVAGQRSCWCILTKSGYNRSILNPVSLSMSRSLSGPGSRRAAAAAAAQRSLLEDEDDDGEDEGEDDTDDDEFGGSEDEEDGEVEAGDGEDGGGIVLAGAAWGSKALEIARKLLPSGGELSLYGFKVCPTGFIQVRLDKLTDRFGSPTIQEVEKFNCAYLAMLEEAGEAGLVPSTVAIEVSSPGAERVLQIPRDFLRFKELPMQVFYCDGASSVEQHRILELDSFDQESLTSGWKLANVRANRESAGKGRSLNKKQREWRLELPVSSIRMVRLYVDVAI